MILLVFGAVGVILWIGGHDVVAGRISPGQLSAFVFYAVIVASAVGTISEVVGDLQRAAGATERLFELLEIDAGIRAPANPVPLPVPARGTVAFRDVTFHYPSRPDAAALEDFSLDVAAGRNRGAGRAVRRRQDHGVPAAAALLRSAAGSGDDRRRRPARPPTPPRCGHAWRSCRRIR